jgi:hypothetical protein
MSMGFSNWIPAEQPPELVNSDGWHKKSEVYLCLMKYGGYCLCYYYVDDLGLDRWTDDCSEGWDRTGSVISYIKITPPK